MSYEELVEEAAATRFEGWDWSVFHGRLVESSPSWDFGELVRARSREARSMLDLGTGGGEFLSSLAPLPPVTSATEGYRPNVPAARRVLEPMGVTVVDTSALEEGQQLPFPDSAFDFVVSRHEAYRPAEVRRVLRPGGRFLTQQVGGRNMDELNSLLGASRRDDDWDLVRATAELTAAGFEVSDEREELVPATFHDIGAVVLYLRVVPWQIPDFDPVAYEKPLRALHATLSAGTPLTVASHRFLVEAR
jgi:SAM-dependent methyltransferase